MTLFKIGLRFLTWVALQLLFAWQVIAVETSGDFLDDRDGHEQAISVQQGLALEALKQKILDELNDLPVFSAGLRGDKLAEFDIIPGGIRLKQAALQDYLRGNPEWLALPTVDYSGTPALANMYATDIRCATDDMMLCLLFLNNGGDARTAVVEVNLVSGQATNRGFWLPFGYNDARYLGVDGEQILFHHSKTRAPNSVAPSFYLWKNGSPISDAQIIIEKPENATNASIKTLSRRAGTLLTYALFDGSYVDIHVTPEGAAIRNVLGSSNDTGLHPVYRACLPLFELEGRLYCRQKFSEQVVTNDRSYQIPRDSVISIPIVVLSRNPGGDLDVQTIYRPKPDEVLEEVQRTKSGMLLKTFAVRKAREKLYFAPHGKALREVVLPFAGSVEIVQRSKVEDAAIVKVEGYLTPPGFHYLRLGTNPEEDEWRSLPINLPTGNQRNDFDIQQRSILSDDGFTVSYEIIGHPDVIGNGDAPVVITAYAYDYVTLKPAFQPGLVEGWLDKGGLYVVAHPRGGGEYRFTFDPDLTDLERRQRSIDDLTLVVRDLVHRGLADPLRIYGDGTSAGASLIVTAALQNPGLFRSVAAHAGCYDINLTGDACGAFFKPVKDGFEGRSDITTSVPASLRARLLIPAALLKEEEGASSRTAFLLTANRNDDTVFFEHSLGFRDRLREAGYLVSTVFGDEGGHDLGQNPSERAGKLASKWMFFLQAQDSAGQNKGTVQSTGRHITSQLLDRLKRPSKASNSAMEGGMNE